MAKRPGALGPSHLGLDHMGRGIPSEYFGPSWAQFGPILGPLGPILGPIWAHGALLGPFWVHSGPFWAL